MHVPSFKGQIVSSPMNGRQRNESQGVQSFPGLTSMMAEIVAFL